MGRDPDKAKSCLKRSCLVAILSSCSQRPHSARGTVSLNQNRHSNQDFGECLTKSRCVMPCHENLLSSALGNHKLLPRNIPKPGEIFNQQEVSLHTANIRKLNPGAPNWLRLSKRHQSEALVHNEHKDFSPWHRKSLTKCWNNTDLISWLEFLGMLSSGI